MKTIEERVTALEKEVAELQNQLLKQKANMPPDDWKPDDPLPDIVYSNENA